MLSSLLLFLAGAASVPPPSSAAPVVQAAAVQDRRHEWGLGGRTGGFTFGVGASVRYWGSDRWGIQTDVSRYGVNYVSGEHHVLQFSPVALFVLGHPDLSKEPQVRPYAGLGLNIFRASTAAVFTDESTTSAGAAAFIGAELVFRRLPNFGMSGDIGYYQTGSFGGVDIGGFAISLSGHYYIK